MVEPLYNKEKDFAMEFYAEGGNIHFLGYSLFETDSHGNYKTNILLSDARIEEGLLRYIPFPVLQDTCLILEKKLSEILGKDYQGYLGVDMMICQSPDGYSLHPCVEINLRMNMGIVSHIIFERYIQPQAHGKYLIEYYPSNGTALEMHHHLQITHPAHLHDKKLAKGYFSLTPVLQDTHYHAFLLLD